MDNVLFKDLTPGCAIYALVKKNDELVYSEGSIVSIGQQRVDMSQPQPNNFNAAIKTVVDVTYSIDGKNYTDTVCITDHMFPTNNPGAITLVATEKEPIVRELQVTRKKAEDYIKAAETEVPRNKKRIEDCDKLISQLDTQFAEKQDMERRIKTLEDSSNKTNELLTQILNKLN